MLPTTVIGSYAVPEWLGQLRNDYYQRRISRNYLNEIHDMAIKAAIMDQERAAAQVTRPRPEPDGLDEPFLAGYPEDIALAVEAINIVTDVSDVSCVLHVCYGNRYARPLWAGHYDFLFPAVQDTQVDRLALEFARKGDEDLRLLEKYHWDRGLGLGVIDMKTDQVESREVVAARIGRALRYVAPEQLVINPDCGLRHLQPEAARAKLAVMVAAAAEVRAGLG